MPSRPAHRRCRPQHLDHLGPHGRPAGLQRRAADVIPHDNVCDGPESCREAVRLQIGRGADVIKIATTGGVNSRIGAGLGAQMFEDEARALIETAQLYGKKVAVHAHGADGIKLALRLGADSIEHGTIFDDETIQLFRQPVPTTSRPCRR
jgi:imidazolonepropionase-like amidohydrolase